MNVRVRAFSGLKKALGHQFEVEVEEGAILRDLLRLLGDRMNSREKLLGEDGDLAENLSVLINGLSVNVGKKAEEPLSDGDVVSLLPPSGGG
jgi:molybdopterin synthase sulfur carrier subunit